MSQRKSSMSISRESVQGNFVGTCFTPAANMSNVGIIVVPGSDGGIPEAIAERIAKNGYPSLALGYFGCEGRPPFLENIDLEYFRGAIDAFKVSCKKIVLLGYSRGGELVLLLGSLFPDLVDGIIAVSPSSYVNGGFPHPNRSAWLLNGQPLPDFLQGVMSDREDFLEGEDLDLACKCGKIPSHQNTPEDPYVVADLFHLRNRQALKATIPLEKMTCPLLVIAGEQDKIWPSAKYSIEIQRRLDVEQSTIWRKFLTYPNAGHGILSPYNAPIYHPLGGFWCMLGGSAEGNQQACEAGWMSVMELINQVGFDGNH
jgi:pimeloyl-ACP methyl ester carboxylesterase